MFIGGRVEQSGEIRKEANLCDRDAAIRLLREKFAKQANRLGSVGAAPKIMRIPQGAIGILFCDQAIELSRLLCRAIANNADRSVAVSVKRVYRIDERGGLRMVFRDCYREQFTSAAPLQIMDHGERHHIVDVVPHVGIKNKLDRRGLGCATEHEDEQSEQSFVHGMPIRLGEDTVSCRVTRTQQVKRDAN